MKYDGEKRILTIDVREAVSTARRGMSDYTVYDDDEPDFPVFSLPKGFDIGEKRTLKREFSHGGLDFLVNGEAFVSEYGELSVTFAVPTKRDLKKKETAKQARGEAFMLGAMYFDKQGSAEDDLKINIVYFVTDTREIQIETEKTTRSKLYAFFDKCAEGLVKSGRAEIERVTERLPSMKSVKFPYGRVREGQDEFIRAAYRTIAKGGRLYATAPTGTGKTISAVFPAVRALGNRKCEKVFYLTPKQTTALVAKECIEKLTLSGAKIRSVILIAKDKLCKRGHLCRESKKLCPAYYAKNITDAAMALFDKNIPTVTPDDISALAAEFNVCPYELSLTYSELCDIVICDFNYLFDPQVYIRRFFTRGGSYVFLIDEAHNLAERAREMYSAEISADEIGCADILGEASLLRKTALEAKRIFTKTLLPLLKDEIRKDKDGIAHGAYHSRNLPGDFYTLFATLEAVAEDEFFASFAAKDEEKDARIAFLRNYLFKIKKFNSAIARFDDGFEIFAFLDGNALRAKIFCLDTGSVIAEKLDLGKSAIVFSGTLTPLSYYRALLGGDRSSDSIELNSPFAPEQLSVSVMDKITTRFSEREDSLPAICRVIAATLSARRGNYMIFSPSFAYSEALHSAFKKKYPKIKSILQSPNMTSTEKEEFLNEFSKADGTYLAAFCVMGGIYSEGIDLDGDKLIGSVIVGIGMPSLSYEREAISEYYQEKLDSGVEYAYLYPGMNRVLQAAGRVIRTENDRGVIVLIDDRFDDPIYKKSIPTLWKGIEFISDARILKERLEEFWLGVDEEKE